MEDILVYLVSLVCLVYLVCLVCLVCLVYLVCFELLSHWAPSPLSLTLKILEGIDLVEIDTIKSGIKDLPEI